MSEMVERIAAAIRRTNEETVGLKYTDLTRTMARVAIEAMREPTKAMILAHHLMRHDPEMAWQSMIDEALK